MHRLVGALCAVVLVSLPAGVLAQVLPLADCVTEGSDSAHVQAWFGYRNLSPDTSVVPVGADNMFVPAPADRGQPTTFVPGEFHRVFSVEFPVATRVTWVVQLIEAPADETLPSCDLPLTWLGPWDAAFSYERNHIVEYFGSSWIARRRNLNQPPEPGADWDLLARKGDAGAQGLQGERGEQGPQGDQGPPGVPGITPAFPASPVFTVPGSGRLTIVDPNVEEESVVIVVYVGGRRAGGDDRRDSGGDGDGESGSGRRGDDDRRERNAPAVIEIETGRITILATPQRRIRYVVFR